MSFTEYKGLSVKSDARRTGGQALTNNFKTIADKLENWIAPTYRIVANSAARLALTASIGDYVFQQDDAHTYVYSDQSNNWHDLGIIGDNLVLIYKAPVNINTFPNPTNFPQYFHTSGVVNFYFNTNSDVYVDHPERITSINTTTFSESFNGILDLSKCVNLTNFTIDLPFNGGGFDTIIINNVSSLTSFTCNYSGTLTKINLSGCTSLSSIVLNNLILQSCNITNCTGLNTLSIGNTQLSLDIIGLNSCTALTTLSYSGTFFGSNFDCHNITTLTTVNLALINSPLNSYYLKMSGCDHITNFTATGIKGGYYDFTNCVRLQNLTIKSTLGGSGERSIIKDITGLNTLSALVNFIVDDVIQANSLDFQGLNSLDTIQMDLYPLLGSPSQYPLLTSIDISNLSGLHTLKVRTWGDPSSFDKDHYAFININGINTCSNLQLIDLDGLNNCAIAASSTLNVSGLSHLTTLRLVDSAFTTLNYSNCAALTSITANGINRTIPLATVTSNSTNSIHYANFTGCSLTNIDSIINNISASYAGGTLYFNAGNNATLTVVSATRYNALIANSWTIITNSIPVTTGLYAKWDANYLAATHNTVISTWTDSSGNGRHLTSPAGGLYKTDQNFNGKAVIRFNGNTLNGGYPSWDAGNYYYNASLNMTQPFTIFMVYSLDDTTHEASLIGSYGGNKWYGTMSVYPPNTGSNIILSRGHVGTELFVQNNNVATKQVVTFVNNSPSSKIRVNGNLPSQGGAGTGSDGTTGLILGAYKGYYSSDAIISYLAGYVAEVVVYNRLLDDGELSSVESYLKNKYNIS